MPKKTPRQSTTKTKDLMEIPPITVSEDVTVDEAAGIMWEKNVGSVIVVDKAGTMVGILTERDLLFAVTKSLTGRGIPVSSIMSRTKLRAGPNQSVVTAVEMMRKGGVRHLPVVDKGGRPLGMLSMRDALDVTEPLLKLVFRSSRKKTR